MADQHTTDLLMARLEAAGKRSTAQRHAVCQALVEHGGHPTVADIFERVRLTFPLISQATVYNTIETLEELGLIHRLDIAHHESARYDIDLTPHINVVCTVCGRITNLSSSTLDTLLAQVGQRSGYTIDWQAPLLVYGRCPACAGSS